MVLIDIQEHGLITSESWQINEGQRPRTAQDTYYRYDEDVDGTRWIIIGWR